MSLAVSCLTSIGERLYVKMQSGLYNPHAPIPGDTAPVIDGAIVPRRFHFRLDWLFAFPADIGCYDLYNELRGGIGRIEEPGHAFEGYWLVFYIHDRGRFDFTDFPGLAIVLVGAQPPRFVRSGAEPHDRPECRFGGTHYYSGRGMVSCSEEAMVKWEQSGRRQASFYEAASGPLLPERL